jgi:cyclohexadienyl dehydratase
VRFAVAAEFADPVANVRRVYALMDERLATMQPVAAWKWTHDLPVYDAGRERAVLNGTVLQAQAIGLDAEVMRRLFDLQIEWARTVQERYIATWHAHGFDKSTQVQDLNEIVRPKLDRIGHDLLQALYVSASDQQSAAREATIRSEATQLVQKYALDVDAPVSLATAFSSLRLTTAPTLERILAAGVLRIGTTGDYAPFSLDHAGHVEGLDIALAQRLAQALGVQPMFVHTSWQTLVQDLQSGAFDVAMSGITITPARERLAFFSVPYQTGGKAAIVRCTDMARFDTLEKIDMPNVRVVVNPGGTNEQFVRERVHRARIQVHPDNRTVFDEIIAKRADAMLTDDIEVQLQTHLHPQLCAAFSKPLTQAAKAVMLQRDTALQTKINEWLESELSRGEVKRQLELAIGAHQ